ncbi:MAG: OB-fold nucleic acid binding domain-containing protein [Archaeoglobaceae archaeon]
MPERSEEFKDKKKELREHFGGLLSDETLEMLTEHSLGILEHDIDDLPNIRGKVTVSGSVDKIFGVKEFSTEKRSGLVGNARLTVSGGDNRELKAVFWNDAAEKLRCISEGDSVTLKGFAKQKGEKVEISVNQGSDVEVKEKNVEEVVGVLLAQSGGKDGPVKCAVACDDGVLICSGKGDASEDLRQIEEGTTVKIRGGRQEKKFSVDEVEVLGEAKDIDVGFTSVADLASLQVTNVKGRVSGLGKIKQHKKRELAETYISDESGRVKLVLWDDNVSIYREADIGDLIEVYNGYPKLDWNGEMEVHCGWSCMTMLRRA